MTAAGTGKGATSMPKEPEVKRRKKRRPPPPLPAAVVGLLCKRQVCDALGGICTRSLDGMIAEGKFPRANRRVGKMPRWSVRLVNEWVEEQEPDDT